MMVYGRCKEYIQQRITNIRRICISILNFMYLFHSIQVGVWSGVVFYFSFFLEPFSNSNVCKFMMLFMSKRTLFTSVIYAIVGALFLFFYGMAATNTVSLTLMFSNVIIFYPDKFTTNRMAYGMYFVKKTTECGQEKNRYGNFFCPSLVLCWVISSHLFYLIHLLVLSIGFMLFGSNN